MEQPRLQIIGLLQSDIYSLENAPKNFDESKRVGTLEIYPGYQEGLEGIVAGQTIVVIFWLHKSTRDKLTPVNRKKTGILFNTRLSGALFSTPSESFAYLRGISTLRQIVQRGFEVSLQHAVR